MIVKFSNISLVNRCLCEPEVSIFNLQEQEKENEKNRTDRKYGLSVNPPSVCCLFFSFGVIPTNWVL